MRLRRKLLEENIWRERLPKRSASKEGGISEDRERGERLGEEVDSMKVEADPEMCSWLSME